MNLSPKQIDGLLKMAGSRLGRDPQQLRQQLESGNLQQITQGMNPQQQQQVAEILKDPDVDERQENALFPCNEAKRT